MGSEAKDKAQEASTGVTRELRAVAKPRGRQADDRDRGRHVFDERGEEQLAHKFGSPVTLHHVPFRRHLLLKLWKDPLLMSFVELCPAAALI